MRKIAVSLVLALTLMGSSALANYDIPLPDTVVPGGHTMGIRLQTQGVIVIGFTPVMTADGERNPASDSGIEVGDRITHINNTAVQSIGKLQETVEEAGEVVVATIIRSEEQRELEIEPAIASQNGEKRLGVLIRDGMSGIGTMTFYDPQSGLFGALGHGINDTETGQLLPLSAGDIIPSVIRDVKAGRAGLPGELQGEFPDTQRRGDLMLNTESGIFGLIQESPERAGFTQEPVPLAHHTNIKTGPAVILCNVRGDQVELFDIEIIRLYGKQGGARNMQLRVTDPDLLAITGGIVQGMSGSPILQDGQLIGAVTHVLINDPKRGYGIYAENMFRVGAEVVKQDDSAA